MDARWITTDDAAGLLGLNPTRLPQIRDAERLQMTKEGRRVFYWRPDIEALLVRRANGAKASAPAQPDPPPRPAGDDDDMDAWIRDKVAKDKSIGIKTGTRHTYAAARKLEVETEQQLGRLVDRDAVEAAVRSALDTLRAVLAPEALAAEHGWDADVVERLRGRAYDQVLTACKNELGG